MVPPGEDQQLFHGVVLASLPGMGVGDAAFLVQLGVVHLLRDEMSSYKGSTILK